MGFRPPLNATRFSPSIIFRLGVDIFAAWFARRRGVEPLHFPDSLCLILFFERGAGGLMTWLILRRFLEPLHLMRLRRDDFYAE